MAQPNLQNTYIQEEDETICEGNEANETSMMDHTLMVRA